MYSIFCLKMKYKLVGSSIEVVLKLNLDWWRDVISRLTLMHTRELKDYYESGYFS
jgi:hypothetical protein